MSSTKNHKNLLMKPMSWKTTKANWIAGAFLGLIVVWNPLAGKAQSPTMSEPDSVGKSIHDLKRNEVIENTHVFGEDGVARRDSLKGMLNMFYMDQFRHFQDPRAPYFMFMSKSGDLAFGVGGQVKVKGYFDWDGALPGWDFAPYDIPIPKDPADMRNLAATPSGTGLFFTLLGNHSKVGNFMAYFQADFGGYKERGFRIKKAYLTVGDWTAGYTTTTFEDTKAEPSTVDGAGPNGINSRKNVLIRYMHTWKKHWTVAGSLEFPSQSIELEEGKTENVNPYLPDLAAFAQYQWDGGNSHLRLSGLLRTLTYRDLLVGRNYNITGWALQLSTVLNPVAPLDIFGIISTGRGHASYTTDLGNGNFDLIPDMDNEGRLYAPMAAGFVLGVQYFWTSKLFSNLAFSEQTYYPKKDPNDSSYKYGLYAVGNLFWDITPRFQVGFEYLFGRRKNFDGDSANASRVMAQMMLSF